MNPSRHACVQLAFVGAFLSFLLVDERAAFAQLAPTGSHYGGRASDTGHSPASGTGGYSTTVALDLPAARGGMSVPVALTYGGRGVGAGGSGWDVPISYVRRNLSVARRRPAYTSGEPVQPREQIVVSLGGTTIQMVQQAAGVDVWVARQDAIDLELRKEANGWRLLDGNGQEFLFAPTTGDLWLLKSVTAPRHGNRIELEYDVSSQEFVNPSGGVGVTGKGLSIDLRAVTYNVHPNISTCTKDAIHLIYNAASPQPLSLSLLGDVHLVRMRTLREIKVVQRENCGGTETALRAYDLEYIDDLDTGLPRLAKVFLKGRVGSNRLPVAAFDYGTATTTNGASTRTLTYQRAADIAMPADLSSLSPIATTQYDLAASPWPGDDKTYVTWQNLIDVTGDGRPDLVYKKNGQLWIAANQPAAGGATTLTLSAPVQLSDAVYSGRPLALHTSETIRYDFFAQNRNDVWQQTIDVNGDGRVDIIDAAEEAGRWVFYLNTPVNTGQIPNTTHFPPAQWVRLSIRVGQLRDALEQAGHVIDGDYVPLSRRTTGFDLFRNECWKWNTTLNEYEWYPQGYFLGRCQQVEPDKTDGPEKTFTEWEVKDINGDGYPDVLFNSLPVSLSRIKPELNLGTYLSTYPLRTLWYGGTPSSRVSLNAVLNTVGVRMDSVYPYSAPITLAENHCGVEIWADEGGRQHQTCGVEDVNGDGIADQIVNSRDVHLGTGDSFESAQVTIRLPGVIRQVNAHRTNCSAALDYRSSRLTGLRDLTGDRIPDFVDEDQKVWVGTGTGFKAPITIEGSFVLSQTTERCDGTRSETSSGLYDIDADGKPEFVKILRFPLRLEVHQLVGSAGTNPHEGRLVAIDNGYGATTRVTYRSAKEDASRSHQVPFPEIVVTSVETTGSYGLGGSLSAVRYAYGDAELFFDPALDAFTMRAYGRSVEVHGTGGAEDGDADFAIIRETNLLEEFNSVTHNDDSLRFRRYQIVGRVRATHVLGQNVPLDPWQVLSSFDPATDSRRMAGVHDDWTTQYVPLAPQVFSNLLDCIDVMYPYNWAVTLGTNQGNSQPCAARGFSYRRSSESWLGTQPPPSTANVQTRFEVTEVDNFGNVVSAKNENDRFRTDDDLCVHMQYASTTTNTRIFSALAKRTVTDCELEQTRTLSIDSWEYDQLPVGSVGLGRATSHVIQPHATDNGQPLATIREFEADYDSVGNINYMVSARQEDGALRALSIEYDEFGLAPIQSTLDASGISPLQTRIDRDPHTLEVKSHQDANGTARGRELDEFGRVTKTTVQPPGGSLGVVSTIAYDGFYGTAQNKRTIHTKSFRDPVPPNDVGTTAGQESITTLDELGRTTRVLQLLGTDYPEPLVLVSREYDGLGRVRYEADPHPASQSSSSPYGTTYHFAPDGTWTCTIRGHGPQPLSFNSDASAERFPTFSWRTFENHTLRLSVRRPDALDVTAPQFGTTYTDTTTAIGRVLTRDTTRNGVRLELSEFAHDQLGQLVKMTRFRDPASAMVPVELSLRLDSSGQTLRMTEPEVAPRSYAYSSWGELRAVEWTDSWLSPQPVRLEQVYDALGRITRSLQRVNGSPIADADYSWKYDTAEETTLPSANFTVGRLTQTKSKIGDMHLSYDAFGEIEARAFVDSTGENYFERTERHSDGSLAMLEFRLPDRGHVPEQYRYGYDSASRLESVVDESNSQLLYSADLTDAWGRVRLATYGTNTTYSAAYAETGRRLPRNTLITAENGSRGFEFTGYDAVGRERERREYVDGTSTKVLNHGYDALGHLTTSSSSFTFGSSFSYDPLGNIKSHYDAVSHEQTNLGYDQDQLCRINYGPIAPGRCNVEHDGSGNVRLYMTRAGANRHIAYYPSGAAQSVEYDGATAQFLYDGSGEISELTVTGAFANDPRRDRRLGLFEHREVIVDGSPKKIIVRNIPGPGGVLASRRGADGPLIFPFGEERGTRFTTDGESVVQDVSYQPYGKTTSSGPTPRSAAYTSAQWNGGDALLDLGLVHVGARLYDPAIGRFLSRDPLVVPRTASTTNPYAFALNDPINFADPTGMDPSIDPSSTSFGICGTSSGAACGQSAGGSSGAAAAGLAYVAYQVLSGLVSGGPDGVPFPRFTPSASRASEIGFDPWNGRIEDQVTSFQNKRGRHIQELYRGVPDDLPSMRTVEIDGTDATWQTAKLTAVGGALAAAVWCGPCAKAIALFGIAQARTDGEALSAATGGFIAGLWGSARGATYAGRGTVIMAARLAHVSDTTFYTAALVPAVSNGYFNMVVHGSRSNFVVRNIASGVDTPVSARTVAHAVRQQGWQGQPVRLLSCRAGACAGGPAQQLADELGVKVLAATKDIWVEFGTGAYGWTNAKRPGKWLQFFPRVR